MANEAVSNVLVQKGVDLGNSVELSDEVTFYRVAGGKDALKLWFDLAHRLPAVGAWPMLCCDDAAIEYLRRCRKAAEGMSTVEIIARARAGASTGEGASLADLDRVSTRLFRRALPACLLDDSDEPLAQCYLAIVPGRFAYEIPAYLRFGGTGSCPKPNVHVARLADWGRRYGAVPLVLKESMFECVVARPPMTPEEATELAREQAEYCPDLVRRGLGTQEKLAVALKGMPYWAFWWDRHG